MRNIENGSHRMSHTVYHAQPHIREGHTGNVLGHSHTVTGFGIAGFVHCRFQVTGYHLDGLDFEHVTHFPGTFRD